MKYLVYIITLITGNVDTSYSKLYWEEPTSHMNSLLTYQDCPPKNCPLPYSTNLRDEYVLRTINGADTVYTRLNGEPCNIAHIWREMNFYNKGFEPIKY